MKFLFCFHLRGSWHCPAGWQEADTPDEEDGPEAAISSTKMRKEFPFYTPMGKPIVGTWTITVIMWVSQNKGRIPFHKMCRLPHSLHGTESDNLSINVVTTSDTLCLSLSRQHSRLTPVKKRSKAIRNSCEQLGPSLKILPD